jgi:ketosteroid isomerase-like protein
MKDQSMSLIDLVMTINAQESRLRQAILASDLRELDTLIAEDLLFVGHLGQILTKEMDLAAYRSGALKVDRLEFSETDVRPMGEVVVVVTRASLAGSYEKAPFAGDFRYTRIWRLQAGAWQIAAGHCSAIA